VKHTLLLWVLSSSRPIAQRAHDALMKSRAHHASVARHSMREAANRAISDSAKFNQRKQADGFMLLPAVRYSTLKQSSSRKSRAQPARAGSLLLGLPPLRQIFPEQRRSGRLGLHHDARNSPAVGFFDRLNTVDAARDLLAVAVQRVAAP
jgi:hypothetical protein